MGIAGNEAMAELEPQHPLVPQAQQPLIDHHHLIEHVYQQQQQSQPPPPTHSAVLAPPPPNQAVNSKLEEVVQHSKLQASPNKIFSFKELPNVLFSL